ncbi:hypothetical protein DFN09_002376 [Clostridium acetobutylicum]|nr:hypothetical protein [Clostridium acetobutylicum]
MDFLQMSFKEIKSTLEDMDEQSRLSAAHDIMDDTRKNVKSLGKKILNAYEKKTK